MAACSELTAFRLAVESLEDYALRSPEMAMANYFRNIFEMSEFVQNQGTTRSSFTIKPSAPSDSQSLWTTVSVNGGITTPGCSPIYENIGVNFFERTWSPHRRDFIGPIICKEHLTFQHAIDDFIEAYIYQIRQWIALVWEFGIRGDVMSLGDWYVDGVKTAGPNAAATAPVAYQSISQTNLQKMAVNMIRKGVTQSPTNGDYIMNGNAGPIYPLYIDLEDSQEILHSNPHMRDDSRWASSTMDGEGNFGLWQALGSTRTIGNFRHVCTNMCPRFQFTASGYVTETPFKDISVVGTDQEIFTDAYNNAPYRAAIMAVPSGMKVEVVRPQTAGLNFKPANYNGDIEFVIGGEKICNPPQFDPLGQKGAHFGSIQYAPAPRFPHSLGIFVYKHCPPSDDTIFCS